MTIFALLLCFFPLTQKIAVAAGVPREPGSRHPGRDLHVWRRRHPDRPRADRVHADPCARVTAVPPRSGRNPVRAAHVGFQRGIPRWQRSGGLSYPSLGGHRRRLSKSRRAGSLLQPEQLAAATFFEVGRFRGRGRRRAVRMSEPDTREGNMTHL